MRSMVEGHARVFLARHGQENPHVPLHHPSGGPPPRFGEEL